MLTLSAPVASPLHAASPFWGFGSGLWQVRPLYSRIISTSLASHGVPTGSPMPAHTGGGGGALQSTTPPSVLSKPVTSKAPNLSPHWNAFSQEVLIFSFWP